MLGAVSASIALVISLLVAVPAAAVESAPTAAASSSVESGIAKTAAVVGFNPENIINDALFYDGLSMTSAEIQAFLDAKIGACRNGKCLNVLTTGISSRDAVYSQSTGNLICSAIQGGSMKVSELIYRVQVACGISAKVILVTLQKEQGLTTSKEPSDWNLKAAMGASCPDTAPCDPAFAGVGPQILKGTQQLKTYKAARFAKQPGVNWIGYNPNSACGGTSLNIRNYATAALYSYTPYQPNAAALAAGFGLGDGCSSYGNRNFYQYYVDWFGSTQRAGGPPFGSVDSWEPTPTGVRISGWVVDPDTSAPVDIRVKSDEVLLLRAKADATRVDVGQQYPGYGEKHGFVVDVPLAPGTQTVCVAANNVGVGSNRTLGCTELTPIGGDPVGAITSVEVVNGGVRVRGWAIDPDSVGPVTVRIKSDEQQVARVLADAEDEAVAEAYRAFGPRHAFAVDLKLPAKAQNLCVAVNNVGVGVNRTVGCRTVTPQGGDPFGAVTTLDQSANAVTLLGWAIDPDTVDPISVRVKVDEQQVASATARADRGELAATYPGFGTQHGFEVRIELAAGTHTVCVAMNNVGAGVNRTLPCRTVTVLSGAPFGEVESWTRSGSVLTASGWAIDPDSAEPISIRAKVDEVQVARALADGARPDIAQEHPAYGDRHGFQVQIPLTPGTHTVCIALNNVGAGTNRTLPCTSVTVRSGDPFGEVDTWALEGGTLRLAGWAIDPDTVDPASIRVKVDEVQVARITASAVRDDVALRHPAYGPRHGFTAQVPLSVGTHNVCVAMNNVGAGVNRTLRCGVVTVPAP